MQAQELLAHFREIGHWVLWDLTEDRFIHGDPAAEVRGIAVAWSPTDEALRQAQARGANVFITHEPAHYPGFEGTASGQAAWANKQALFDELGLTVLRCHDTWDKMPGLGVVDAWAGWLGLPAEPRPVDSFYRTCLVEDLTVEALAGHILERVRPLGQDWVQVLGDGGRRVRRLAIGTGAITNLAAMQALQPDAILATDDGLNYWTGGLWALDTGRPILIVNHATSELPGMLRLAEYLRQIFPAVPVGYLDVRFAPRTLVAGP